MSFGENLTNLRRQKGWSQDDLANNLDLSRQAISKWENETSKPDIDNIKKISKIFSIKIDELINNELPDDKAVTLDVKKEEKREKTITIIKLMIIAVIILYVISVIYKFSSLLVIVNGVQKYANLNNYHYVITTYDENGLAEKEECWFKDGVSKTVNIQYNNSIELNTVTYINYNENEGYVYDTNNNEKTEINITEFCILHSNYKNGGQLFSKLPVDIRSNNAFSILSKCLNLNELDFIKYDDANIFLLLKTGYIVIDKETLFPIATFSTDKNFNTYFNVELNNVDNVKI